MDLPNAKIFNVRLNRGDANMMQSGGGGGVGVEEEASK
jgi:N-methylhydantoinase B